MPLSTIVNKMVKVSLVGKVTFEQRVKGGSHVIAERRIFRKGEQLEQKS